jgi:hypothetical protein
MAAIISVENETFCLVGLKIIRLLQNIVRLLHIAGDSLGSGIPKQNVHVSLVLSLVENNIVFNMMDVVNAVDVRALGSSKSQVTLFHLFVVMRMNFVEQSVSLKIFCRLFMDLYECRCLHQLTSDVYMHMLHQFVVVLSR